MSIASQ